MKIVAFSTSNSKQSINKKLVCYAARVLEETYPGTSVEIIDINDYEMPLFSVDREAVLGHPDEAKAFYKKLGEADALIISHAEHNGSYTAAFKNLFDWTSRIDVKVFQGKPTVLLATSPGKGGAQTVLKAAAVSAPHFGADLKASLSLPTFYDIFSIKQNTLNDELADTKLRTALATVFPA
ncbi:MAG: NAD(P)H-dependent oxidoreductase [Kordiimonadaceae bacterium]|nr:NAD(P)H-dependent oxidoreductase [Kordiimonadaceae bacterium]